MEIFESILLLIGRLHLIFVHFPIGLLVFAFLLELFTLGGKRDGLRNTISILIFSGTICAVLASACGYILKTSEGYEGILVQNHQYAGITTAALSILTSYLLYRTIQNENRNLKLYRAGLSLTFISLLISGHLGASLTHGENFLTEVFDKSNSKPDNQELSTFVVDLKSRDTLSGMLLDKLNLQVRGIFAHHCYQCHSGNKRKGDLELDSKEGVFRGGESGAVIIAGNPEKSELYRRISLPAGHEDVMPTKGKLLSEKQVELVKMWIQNGAHWAEGDVKVFPEAKLALDKPDLPEDSERRHPIDQIVHAYFVKEKIKWPKVVDDRTFIRRAYLDVIGLLPPPEVVEIFIRDQNKNKRTLLIDSLLNDNENYTLHWLSFWNDLLRNDYGGTGFITGGRKEISGWLYHALYGNSSYDQMVKELVNPSKESEGFIKGIQWRGVVNASQTTQMQAAQNIGQSLMGINVKCASCHNSFVSNLTLEQVYGFASVFSDSLLEMNRCDQPLGKYAKMDFLYPELGNIEGETVAQRLGQLANIIVKRENGRLYRTLVNRYWEKLMGRGIIMPVDEMDNTPWSGELLDWLAADFVDSDADIKKLLKTIMTSDTYQLPVVNHNSISKIQEDYVFTGPMLRRLTAEQFTDAVSQVIHPVFAAVDFNPSGQKTEANRIWHEEISFDRTVLPEPGKRYFRKQFELESSQVISAQILISVDDAYVMYLNGEKISQNSDWKKVGKLDVRSKLKVGSNVIAIEGVNEGLVANPAGLLFSMKIVDNDQNEFYIHSDPSWKTSQSLDQHSWTSIEYNDDDWKSAKNYGHQNWGDLLHFTFDSLDIRFVRASLVKQHPFLKSLGRPDRDIVSTSRDSEATLLQALELTNGEFFNAILSEGANHWVQTYDNNAEEIVQNLYKQALGREPSAKEKATVAKWIGKRTEEEQVQDLIWSTLLQPEFQFIY